MNSPLNRLSQIKNWVSQQLKNQSFDIFLVSGDASFRQYYRVKTAELNFIAVDAPPAQENNPLFVNIATCLRQHNLLVPEVIKYDFVQGFMLLSDFGDVHIANIINQTNYQQIYRKVWQQIYLMQQIPLTACQDIADYSNELVEFELSLFNDWFLQQHLTIRLNDAESQILQQSFSYIRDIFQSQPKVVVHRDFHSRNIMLPQQSVEANIGIIDFQGALTGPLCYDLVSLLKDCYLVWPPAKVLELAEEYRQQYHPETDAALWRQWFEITGLQRHIKCAGIFARLHHRDGKSGYLKHIPDVLTYILTVTAKYPALTELHQLLTDKIQTQ